MHYFVMTRFNASVGDLSSLIAYLCYTTYVNIILQVEDLSRMYRLFSRITRGLEPVSQIFKQVPFASNMYHIFINMFNVVI